MLLSSVVLRYAKGKCDGDEREEKGLQEAREGCRRTGKRGKKVLCLLYDFFVFVFVLASTFSVGVPFLACFRGRRKRNS